MGRAAAWCGSLKGDDHQPHHVTRGHAETPLIVRLLGTHQAQSAIAPVLGIKVKGHGCGGEEERESWA